MEVKNSPIAILFDIDDTLLPNITAFRRVLNEDLGFDLTQQEATVRYKAYRNQADVLHGLLNAQPYDDMAYRSAKSRWELVLDELNYSNAPAFCNKLEKIYHRYQKDVGLPKEVEQALLSLAEKDVLLGVISNGKTKAQTAKCAQLGLERFMADEMIFISESLGISKPHRQCFEKVLAALPDSVEEIYFVGDNYKNDIAPVLEFGIKPIWIDRHYREADTEGVIVCNTYPELAHVLNTIL